MNNQGTDNNITSACIDRWRKQLLDLTGRNRMLFYKKSRASISIHNSEKYIWENLIEQSKIELDEVLLVPKSTSDKDLNKRIEEVHKRVKRLSEIARTFLDEQGVHVIYAAFGWLNWVDETRSPMPGEDTVELANGKVARRVHSPLLFVPINLEITSNGKIYVKVEENALIETNLTLESYLDQQYGFSIHLNSEEDLTPSIVSQAWRKAILNYPYWDVEEKENVIIDAFSFRKISLLRQLEQSFSRVKQQAVLQAFCGNAELLQEAPAVPSFGDLDDSKISERLNIVVPADSSQIKAVYAVQQGTSLVVQGPPGTGKSQTITNIISTLISAGKRVLFIAEKRPAREIVVENLVKCGLGDIVLHITEEVSGSRGRSQAKRDIVDQLSDILEQGPGIYDVSRDFHSDYQRVSLQLNGYVRALHGKIGPSSLSTPFNILATWSSLDKSLIKSISNNLTLPSIKKVDDYWKEQASEYASRIDDLGEDVLISGSSPWIDAEISTWDSEYEKEITAALNILMDAPLDITRILQKNNLGTCSDNECTVSRITDYIFLLRCVGEHYELKKKVLRILNSKYRKTKSIYENFEKRGGFSPEIAIQNSIALEELIRDITKSHKLIASLFPNYIDIHSIIELSSKSKFLCDSIATAPNCARIRARCFDAKELGIEVLLLELVKARNSGENIKSILEVALYKHWSTEAIESNDFLHKEGSVINRLAERLREYEKQANQNARLSVINAVAPNRPSLLNLAPKDSELGILKHQINAKRRKSLRWLFTKAANLILQMKPCIVASPLAVAQFLQSDSYEFDIVIFDEASQIPTADAAVPITKAKQVVIVGDSQQMPPTSFFDRAVSFDAEDADEFTFDSVLQNSEAILPSLSLNWHYRSLDERLIAFSNHHFYGGKLLTFPSAWSEHPDLGVKFVYLANAQYGRGGSKANPEEAEKAISILEEELEFNPDNEVGLIAMSIAQASEIESRLEQRAASSQVIKGWIDNGGRARNLETVQGDEFDISILSFGYGKDSAGNLQLNFGPLSREDGYKRLNVCVTRARKKMIVVSSIRSVDIPPGRVREGGQRVRQFLEYAEQGSSTLSSVPEKSNSVFIYESPFEQQVANEILNLGWCVDTQVGVQKFRIDIGIRHPKIQGKYLAGIECDGATYHNHETARDRDIGRQQVLEKLGWVIYRIWSVDWFRNKESVLQNVNDFLNSLLEDEHSDDSFSKPPQDPDQDLSNSTTVNKDKNEFINIDTKHKLGNLRKHNDIQQYTDTELLRALSLACFEVGSISKSDIARFTCRFLGFGRATKRITNELERLIPLAIKDKYLKENDGRYLPGYRVDYQFIVSPTNKEIATNEKYKTKPIDSHEERYKETPGLRKSNKNRIKESWAKGYAIRIGYCNATGHTSNRIVEILGMGNNYFDAFDHLKNEQRTFRIDRVINVEPVNIRISKSRSYWKSTWVSKNK